MAWSHFILTCIAVFSFLCIIGVLFFERKNPASSLVWVLVLLFIPVAGPIFYLFLGSGFRVNKRKKYAMKAYSDAVYNNHIVKHLATGRTRLFVSLNEETSRLLNYLRTEGDGVFTDDNDAKIYIDGNEMFADLMEDMRQATHHIHVLFYIFRNDRLGREILSILEDKAREGIEVRIIYDSIGTLMAFDTMFAELKKAGGTVVPFSPLFSSLSSHLRLNYRNHRKIVIIDGTIGYLGGMNVGEEYCGGDAKLSPWRDTHLRITGSAVWFIQERFFMDWGYASETDPHVADVPTYFPASAPNGSMAMQIVSSGPDTHGSPIKSGMLSMLYGARKNIYIQTPYYAPDESFLDAMRIASRSGVDVRLMIPKQSDYRLVHGATMGYARESQLDGVNVFMYNGFIHSKTIVVDGEVATIGSTNITNRSFTLDFEVNAFIYDCAFAARCESIFHADEANCDALPTDYFSKKGMLTRASYNFARMFAPMM